MTFAEMNMFIFSLVGVTSFKLLERGVIYRGNLPLLER